jgi:cold shock CspA family protein
MTLGVVQWFDLKRGVGFIHSDDHMDIFVDLANVKASMLEDLIKGQRIEFDIYWDQENNKARAARNIKILI